MQRIITGILRSAVAKTPAILIPALLYVFIHTAPTTEIEPARSQALPKSDIISASYEQGRHMSKINAYVSAEEINAILDDTEPQLPPEDLEPEPQLPPDELEEITLPAEPDEPSYPTRNDIVKGKNSLAPEYQIAMQEACAVYSRVKYPLALAVCDVESSFNENAKSDTNDVGLMQINEINRKALANAGFDIDDPIDNIWGAIYMLDGHLAATNDNVSKALMRYNNGAGGAAKLWRKGVYQTAYTNNVTNAMEKYEQLLRS